MEQREQETEKIEETKGDVNFGKELGKLNSSGKIDDKGFIRQKRLTLSFCFCFYYRISTNTTPSV